LNTQDFIVRAAAQRKRRLGIAFGAERLALIPFRAPTATVLIALALAVLTVLGIQRIRIDDSLSQLFHSESPAFKLFEQVSHDFPSSEYDVMIVVTGDILHSDAMARRCTAEIRDEKPCQGRSWS
jgi:predicted RND superfamily exporter protein